MCASADIIDYIKHQGRGFIYSASITPPNAAAALAAFDVIENEPYRVERLQKNASRMTAHLIEANIDTLQTETAIIPAICHSDERAWWLAKECMEKGVFVQGIPYPVVSKNLARLRCIVTADHSDRDIDIAADVIIEAFRNRP